MQNKSEVEWLIYLRKHFMFIDKIWINGALRAKPVVPPLKYPSTPLGVEALRAQAPRLRRVIHRWRNPLKHQALSTRII